VKREGIRSRLLRSVPRRLTDLPGCEIRVASGAEILARRGEEPADRKGIRPGGRAGGAVCVRPAPRATAHPRPIAQDRNARIYRRQEGAVPPMATGTPAGCCKSPEEGPKAGHQQAETHKKIGATRNRITRARNELPSHLT